MSHDQTVLLLAKLQEDAELREKVKSAASDEARELIVKEAGFNVTKEDFRAYQASQTADLSDEQLEAVAGGGVCLVCGVGKSTDAY